MELKNDQSGYHVSLNSRATSVLVGLWCLMTVVLANGYAGTLFSFLSVAKLEPIINSLEELAMSNDIQLVTQAHSIWVGYLMVSSEILAFEHFNLHLQL